MIVDLKKDIKQEYKFNNIREFSECLNLDINSIIYDMYTDDDCYYTTDDEDALLDDEDALLDEVICDIGEWTLIEKILQYIQGEYYYEYFLDDDNYNNDYGKVYVF
jgi:hypothetical protein